MATEAVAGSGRWSLLVLAAAMLTVLIVAFAPLVSTSTCYESSDGGGGCSSSTSSLVANEGAGILAVGMLPIAVAAVPALVRRSKWTVRGAAVVLTLMVFVAGSAGLLLIPTVVLAWVADAATATGRN